ncbi:formyltransferase family protein [Algibacter sp. R77976]|uniref:formyltransferase family protein n=1 Tax=Algibacter sp. R77976 TaxID=3093873 RepID=UPI0037C5B00F
MVKNNWAFFCSFWGKNAKDTIESYLNNSLKNSNISLLVYESEPCGAAEIARLNNIDTLLINKDNFSSSREYQKTILNELLKKNIDFIFLLGYQHLVQKDILNAYPNKIVNIHPSLFPSFLATKTAIQDAINYGVKLTGITTHIIDDKFDRGTILFQESIRVKKNDSLESLTPKFSKKGLKMIIKTIKKMEKSGK